MTATFRVRVNDAIELAALEELDAPELFALVEANRLYLREWLPWLDGSHSVADTVVFIQGALRQLASNQGFSAGVRFHGRLCGIISHHGISWATRSTSLGYWLDAAHQRNGIMTEACRAVVNHAFTELELDRVVIRCAVENKRSRAIPERLGFTLEGIARQADWLYDRFVDIAIYARLKRDG